MTRLFLIVALATLMPRGPAQAEADDGREIQRGSVTGLDGQPWAGARVVLHARGDESQHPLPPGCTLPMDLVEVTANERGRFQARLLPRRDYLLAATAAGSRRVTEIVWRPGPRPVHLFEARRQPEPKRLRFYGIEAWQAHGPIEVVVIDGLGRRTPLVPAMDAPVDLPFGFGSHRSIEVKAGGLHLCTQHVAVLPYPVDARHAAAQRQDRQLEAALAVLPGLPDLTKEDAPADVACIVVGPPLRVRARILDAATSAPIAGATVGFYDRGGPRLTTTDHDGRCEPIVPLQASSFGRGAGTPRLFARAPGYATRGFRWTRQRYHDFDRPIDEALDGTTEIELPLVKGIAMRGRIQGTEALSPSRVILQCQVVVPNEAAGQVRGGSLHQENLVPDADGAWSLLGFHPSWTSARHIVWLPGDAVRALAPDGAFDAPFAAFPLLFRRDVRHGPATADIDAGTFDLADIRFIDLQLELPDGSPARGAYLSWSEPDAPHGYDFFSMMTRARADRRGLVRLAITGRVSLAVHSEEHFVLLDLETPQKHGSRTIRLQPMGLLSGRVIDQAGRPVVGARVFQGTYLGGEKSRQHEQAANANMAIAGAMTGPGGRFELRYLHVPGFSMQPRASLDLDSGTVESKETDLWLTGEPLRDCEIRLALPSQATKEPGGK